MSAITIKFRAKRDNYMNGFALEPGYKVPAIKHSHVTYENRDTRVQLFLSDLNNDRVTRARLAKNGVGAVAFESDARWTITPIGNGFMADVSTVVEV
ncbi:hypothetical protein [Mycobacterium phage WXIN]|nr:hypothetical protein [Mycobacterium phage WXIN]